MILNFVRILKNSIKNITRNLWLSLATLSIVVLALSMIGGLILFRAGANTAIEIAHEKADYSLYFNKEVQETEVQSIKEMIEKRPEVASIEYKSPDTIIEELRAGEESETVQQVVRYVDENIEDPFGASLHIKLYDIEFFDELAGYINDIPDIETLLHNESRNRNAELIAEIDDITRNTSYIVFGFIVTLCIFVFLVTYNTIKLAIYTAKTEIHIMKLVGASNWFTRGPFIITGFCYALFASLVTMGLLFLVVWQIDERIAFLQDIQLYEYVMQNGVYIYLILLGAGIMLSVVSSYIAVRRYLKV